jgi:hypothetical protein
MANNISKNRKTEAQDIFDQAQNMGRFAGDGKDAKAARQNAVENIEEQISSSNKQQQNRQGGQDLDNENTDAEARRDPAQAHDYKGEAQDVNYGDGRPLQGEEELEHARDKATEDLRQKRSE